MKYLRKIASASEAVAQEYNVIYATDTEVVIKKQVVTYTITFSDWDGSILSQTTYNEGEAITVPSNPTRTGYTFTGWSPTIVPTAVADTTYVAEYEEKVNIKLYYSDGTVDKYKTNTVMTSGLTKNKTTLVAAELNEGVTNIGNGAFKDCSNLTSITIPDSVTMIANQAFNNCLNLTSVTIPDSVTSIGNATFLGCSSLSSVTIGNSVTSIGDRVFEHCTSLTSVTIPDSVTYIGNRVFYGCRSLTSVTIPYGVTRIYDYVFYNCTSLTSVIYNGTTTQWNSITKGSLWRGGVPSECIVHCTDGDISI